MGVRNRSVISSLLLLSSSPPSHTLLTQDPRTSHEQRTHISAQKPHVLRLCSCQSHQTLCVCEMGIQLCELGVEMCVLSIFIGGGGVEGGGRGRAGLRLRLTIGLVCRHRGGVRRAKGGRKQRTASRANKAVYAQKSRTTPLFRTSASISLRDQRGV